MSAVKKCTPYKCAFQEYKCCWASSKSHREVVSSLGVPLTDYQSEMLHIVHELQLMTDDYFDVWSRRSHTVTLDRLIRFRALMTWVWTHLPRFSKSHVCGGLLASFLLSFRTESRDIDADMFKCISLPKSSKSKVQPALPQPTTKPDLKANPAKKKPQLDTDQPSIEQMQADRTRFMELVVKLLGMLLDMVDLPLSSTAPGTDDEIVSCLKSIREIYNQLKPLPTQPKATPDTSLIKVGGGVGSNKRCKIESQ